MSMIEKVARAIHREDWMGLEQQYADIAWDDGQDAYRRQARAAIEAMLPDLDRLARNLCNAAGAYSPPNRALQACIDEVNAIRRSAALEGEG